jgi:oligoribonuclease NrnB/cAMP/cGMP phosphodiesterase (DHH superfamily)
MSDKPIVIYHSPCLDGFTAAWACWLKHPDAEFVPGVYGQAPPKVKGREVYLLDFSYKRPVLLEMAQEARRIVILDHHKTAQAELAGLLASTSADPYFGRFNLDGVFDMDKSGARLAWEWFHPGMSAPKLVQYVEDRDLWRFALPQSRAVNAALFSYPATFATWSELHKELSDATGYWAMVNEGEALERKQAKDVADLTGLLKHRIVIGGVEVWCANVPHILASDVAGNMAEGEPFAATYFIDAGGKAVFSLRSRNGGADVSEVAKLYGGGGHRNAAGFSIAVYDCAESYLGGLKL